MKINSIRLHGITTFTEEGFLDLEALGPGIIAVAGPNGSGKTSLLESIPGGLYRFAPSRGSIAGLATSRDAMIEITGENGAPFKIRLDIDNHSGRQEALFMDEAGEPIAGPKVKEFDAEISKKFAPIDVYLASFFASQTGVGSVLKMSRSDRRALFGRLLGLERLEAMAVAAREKARAAESEMTAALAALEAIRSGVEDVSTLEEQFLAAKEREAKAAGEARQASERLKAATAERDRLAEEARERERASLTARAARGRANEAESNLANIELKVKALEPILGRAPEIRAAAAKIKELTAEVENIRGDGESLAHKAAQAQGSVDKKVYAVEIAEREYRDAGRAETEATLRADEMKRRLDAANKATAVVPCAGALEDAVRSACPALVGHFKIRDEATRIIDEQASKAAGLTAAAVAAGDALLKAQTELEAAKTELRSVAADVDAARAKFKEIRDRVLGLQAKDQSAQLDRAEAEKAGLQGILAMAKKSAAEATAEADKLWAALSSGPAPGVINAAQAAVESSGMDHETALQDAQEANGRVVRLDEQLRRARDAHAKAEALAEKLAPMEAELAEWRWLGRGLGREGVQALELDAAGPQVSGLANELLADAYGPRFQVRFETQAAKADGKGVKETFDIVVVDTERGREGNGEDLSGGEKVIVGEALGLAVGLFHAQAAGVSLGTVIRDETVGALDPENGERYLAMLRAFLRVGHVHQLLYVAHNPALIDLADAVVRVEDGRIEVR